MTYQRQEHRIYKSIDRSPELWGLPIAQAAAIMACGALGFFILKPMAGWLGAGAWLALGAGAWVVLGFINRQDKTFMPMLKLRLGVRFQPHVVSGARSRQGLSIK